MPSVDLIADTLSEPRPGNCDPETIRSWIPCVINLLISELYIGGEQGNRTAKDKSSSSPFYIKNRIRISFEDYLERVQSLSGLEDEIFFLALIYFDRFTKKSDLDKGRLSIHKLFLAALTVAMKFVHDDHLSLEELSRIGGIPKAELIELEKEFLNLIGYRVYVGQNEYTKYVDNITKLFFN